MELLLHDLQNDYVQLVEMTATEGEHITVRGLPTRELEGVTLVIPDVGIPLLPLGVGRRVNARLAAVEALTLVAGVARPRLLERAAPGYHRVLVDPHDESYGAYGPRVRLHLNEIVELLDRDPTSRQAVLAIWNAGDLRHRGDKPCTIALHFLVRDDGLHLHTWMRSQDVWLGVPYDLFQFSQLQHTVARVLGLEATLLVHRVSSLHLYERDLAAAERLHPLETSRSTDDGHPVTTVMNPVISLPRGVITPDVPADWSATERWNEARAAASRLLDHEADSTLRDANPGYARELDRLYLQEVPGA